MVMTDAAVLDKPKVNVFKNKNFSLLFWGVFVSNVAHIIFNFAISLYLLNLLEPYYGKETSAMIQAIYLAVSGIVLVLLIPFGGVIADKISKVKIMYITDFIRGITILLTGLILWIDLPIVATLIALFVMNIILAVNASFFSPAAQSLLRFIVSDEELQPGASLLQGSSNFQSILGLILGGILFSTLGIVWIFLINGIAYLISAITEIFIKYQHHDTLNGQPMTMKEMLIDIKSGAKYLWNQRGIFDLLLMALAINFFTAPLFANAMPYFISYQLAEEPAYLFKEWFTPENWFSIIEVAFSIGAIIMSLYMAKQTTKSSYAKQLKFWIVGLLIPLVLVSLFMIGYYQSFATVNILLISTVVLMFVMGFANVGFNVPVSLIFQRRVDPLMLGKVSSVSSVLSQALIPISSLVAGAIIMNIGITSLYIFSIIGMILVAGIYLSTKSINQL